MRIVEERQLDEKLRQIYSNYRRRLTPLDSPSFEVLDKSRPDLGQLVQIDKETGIEVAKIEIPAVYAAPAALQNALVGHLLPVANQTSMQGVSLLERQVSWQTVPPGMGRHPETTLAGPSGTDFCTFQTRRGLFVLDPGTGAVRWQRDDLEADQGLFFDAHTGLIGDREALVVFSQDRLSYTVYRTSNGEVVRRGKVNVSSRHLKLAFGRKLLFVTDSASPELQLWDPLHNRLLFAEPFTGKIYSLVSFADEFVVSTPSGQVRVFDAQSGRTRLDIQLDPAVTSNVNLIRAFSDGPRYYLNLQRSGLIMQGNYGHVTDSFLPVVHVSGELYAVEAASGNLLWSRVIPQQTVLHLPQYRLPFLVSLSRVRNRTTSSSSQSLRIEAVDCQTGAVLGNRPNSVSDRILQMAYDRDAGRLELRGALTRITLEFGPDAARFPADAPGPELLDGGEGAR